MAKDILYHFLSDTYVQVRKTIMLYDFFELDHVYYNSLGEVVFSWFYSFSMEISPEKVGFTIELLNSN